MQIGPRDTLYRSKASARALLHLEINTVYDKTSNSRGHQLHLHGQSGNSNAKIGDVVRSPILQ